MAREVSNPRLKNLLCCPSLAEVKGGRKRAEMHATATATTLSDITSPSTTPQALQKQQRAKTLGHEPDSRGSYRTAALDCAPSRMVITSMLQPCLSLTDLHQNIFAKRCDQDSLACGLTKPFASSPRKIKMPAPHFQPLSGLRLQKEQSKQPLLRENEAFRLNEVDTVSWRPARGTTSGANKPPERAFLPKAPTRNGGSMRTSKCRIGSRGHKLVQPGVCGSIQRATLPLICSFPLQLWPQHQQEEVQNQHGACRPVFNPVLQRKPLSNPQEGQQSLDRSLKRCSALEGMPNLLSHSQSRTSHLPNSKPERGNSSDQAVPPNDKQFSRDERAFLDGKPKVTSEAPDMSIMRPCSCQDTSLFPCAQGALDSRLDAPSDNTQIAPTGETDASTAASGIAPSVQMRPSKPISVKRLDSEYSLVNVALPLPTPLRFIDSKSAKAAPTPTATKAALMASIEATRACCGSGAASSNWPVSIATSPGVPCSPSRAMSVPDEKSGRRRAQSDKAVRKPARPWDSAGRLNVAAHFDADTVGPPQSPSNPHLLACPAIPNPRREGAMEKNSEGRCWLNVGGRDKPLMRKQTIRGYEALLSSGSHSVNFARTSWQDGYFDQEEDPQKHQELERLRHTTISFVCVDSLTSLLERGCCISHFGPDEHLQQKNDLATSPFHCSSKPQISLEEYLIKRIFKHGRLCINEGILALALLSRFLCSQNAALADALQSRQQSQQQQAGGSKKAERMNTLIDLGASGHALTSSSPLHSKTALAATAAQIGFVEFNHLTAHRLLLTAAVLAKKTHRDEHTNIRHWAQVRISRQAPQNTSKTKMALVTKPKGNSGGFNDA